MTDEVQRSVAPEPKVFVGQVPLESTEEQLRDLMAAHGELQSVTIPRKSDSRRFAMVTFAKWAHAESAVDTLHGTCSLGGAKPLVVRFADPPKGDDAKGIYPKKLFVGQVCNECWAAVPIFSRVLEPHAIFFNCYTPTVIEIY